MSTDTPKSAAGPGQGAGGASSTSPTTGDHTSPTAQQQEELRQRAREVQERIEEGYHELEERYDNARTQLRRANDRAVDFIRENPAICIVGAVGVGYLVGRLASRRWLT